MHSRLLPSALMLFGLTGLIALLLMNRAVSHSPVSVPMTLNEGDTFATSFVVDQDGMYDIEVELHDVVPDGVMKQYVTINGTSSLDVDWTLKQGDNVVARGGCAHYLFVSGESLMRRWITSLLGLQDYDDISVDRFSRGVGRFEAKAGQKLELSTKVKTAPDALIANGSPQMVIRFDRRRRVETLEKSLAVAGLAIVAFVAGGMWLLRVSLQNRRLKNQHLSPSLSSGD